MAGGVRGVALAAALGLAALVAGLVFGVTVMAQRYLGTEAHLVDSRRAFRLAEAGLARAVERLQQDETFNGAVLHVTLAGAPNAARSTVAFDRQKARSLGLPFSVNNLRGDKAVEGPSGPVPAGTVHLIKKS